MLWTPPTSEAGATAIGRRERKKRATRLALKAAAIDLIGERGFAHVTVEDIAEAADVSVRTFFNHFDSKESAIVGLDPGQIERLQQELVALPPEVPPLEALRTIFHAKVQAIGEDIALSGEDHGTWLRRFAVVRSQPEVLLAYAKHLAVLERALTDAVVQRLDDEALRPYATLLTSCAMSVMRAAGSCFGGEGGTDALLDFINGAFDLLSQGLGGDPGLGSGLLAARSSTSRRDGSTKNRKKVAS